MIDDFEKYKDIIDVEYPWSRSRPLMTMSDRAAQFAPFAALTGYEEEIIEAGRLSDCRKEKDETQNIRMNNVMQWVISHLKEHPSVSVTYFVQEMGKSSGTYRTLCGNVKNIDESERTLVLSAGNKIKIEDIYNIELIQQ